MTTSKLTIDIVATTLALAWSKAPPGRETCERDSALRELQRDYRTAPEPEPRPMSARGAKRKCCNRDQFVACDRCCRKTILLIRARKIDSRSGANAQR